VLSATANIAWHHAFQFTHAVVECDATSDTFPDALQIRVQILFEPLSAMEMVLIFFSLGCRFFLDIDVARFYTFFNCSF
jgi:hypothetical protein